MHVPLYQYTFKLFYIGTKTIFYLQQKMKNVGILFVFICVALSNVNGKLLNTRGMLSEDDQMVLTTDVVTEAIDETIDYAGTLMGIPGDHTLEILQFAEKAFVEEKGTSPGRNLLQSSTRITWNRVEGVINWMIEYMHENRAASYPTLDMLPLLKARLYDMGLSEEADPGDEVHVVDMKVLFSNIREFVISSHVVDVKVSLVKLLQRLKIHLHSRYMEGSLSN